MKAFFRAALNSSVSSIALLLAISLIGCVRHNPVYFSPVDGLSISDVEGTTIIPFGDIRGVRITDRSGQRILYFRVTQGAIDRFLRLKEGAKLSVSISNQPVVTFTVEFPMGIGKDGYVFFVPDSVLPDGRPLSSHILRMEK